MPKDDLVAGFTDFLERKSCRPCEMGIGKAIDQMFGFPGATKNGIARYLKAKGVRVSASSVVRHIENCPFR